MVSPSTQTPAGDRYERERAFHDNSYAEHTARADASKFYAVTAASRDAYREALRVPAGARVLEYGCGEGSAAFDLAASGACVTGIDISEVAIATATTRAAAMGLAERLDFRVMNAEHLDVPDASFDLVCGSGILHHLELDKAFAELTRVLRPGGIAVFVEPLGHNPVINLYRRRTPTMRTEDEHPLVEHDFEVARRWFGRVEVGYFHLLALMAVPLRGRRGFDRMLGLFDRGDRTLFREIPRLRKHAWTAVICFGDPLSSRGDFR